MLGPQTLKSVSTINGSLSYFDIFVSSSQECQNDTHPEAAQLRKERVRAYRTTRVVQLDGCQTNFIYRVEAYLIVDQVTEEDSGEYIFNTTIIHTGFSPITVTRSVNVSISEFCSLLTLSSESRECFSYRLPSHSGACKLQLSLSVSWPRQ